ncbi:MAG: TolC family protein [Armatimonadetes bacterium]|nr:TolC family protein [Armatimonadota bacterium]
MMKRAIICLSLLALLCGLSARNGWAGQQPDSPAAGAGSDLLSAPLTLEQAIRVGLQNHPSVWIAGSQLDAAKARLTQVRSSFYPQVEPSFSYSNQRTTQTFNGVRQTGTFESRNTQISLRQLIYDMGRREENARASRYSASSAEFSMLDTRQSIVVNITTAYYDLLRAKDLVKVSEASAERTRTTLEYTRAAAQAGAVAEKDILQAEADYANAQVQLISARNDVALAQTSLKTAMGVLSDQPVVVPDQSLAAPSPEADPLSLTDYVRQAFEMRPDLKSQTASLQSTRHSARVARIDAGLQLQADVTEGYRIDPDPGENRTFSLGVSYPLFDGGAARAQLRQARASVFQSEQQLELTRQSIRQSVEQSYILREDARRRVGAADIAAKAAKKNYEAAQASLQEGAGTVLDVVIAQSQLVSAETSAVQAIYDFYTNEARFRRAIGVIDPVPGGGRS